MSQFFTITTLVKTSVVLCIVILAFLIATPAFGEGAGLGVSEDITDIKNGGGAVQTNTSGQSSNNPPKKEIVPLANLPGLDQKTVNSNSFTLSIYLNTIYLVIISLAGLFAVIKIALGGFQYMLTDIVTSKDNAKKDILGAVLGLIIILSTFIVLNTIYGGLTSFNFLGSQTQTNGGGGQQPPPTPGAVPNSSSAGSCNTGYVSAPTGCVVDPGT